MRHIKSIALLGTFVAAFALPLATHALTEADLTAQINALMQQIAVLQAKIGVTSNQTTNSSGASTQTTVSNSATGAITCPQFSHNQSLGSTGTEVTFLQRYLVQEKLLSAAYVTGSFNLSTQSALQAWQAKYGVVSSGTPATTGYGALGPKTIRLIGLNCSAEAQWSAANASGARTPLQCQVATRPQISCSGTWQAISDSNGCTIAWQCSIPLIVSTSTGAVTTGPTPQTTANQCAPNPHPTTACNGSWHAFTGFNGCTTGWSCQ